MADTYGVHLHPSVGRGFPGRPKRKTTGPRGEIFLTASKRAYVDVVVPEGVYSLCAIGIAGGGGALCSSWAAAGGGGALAWRNNIRVRPGQVLRVYIGRGGVGAQLTVGGTFPPEHRNGGDTIITDLATGEILLHAEGGRTGYYIDSTTKAQRGVGGRMLVGDGGGDGGDGGSIQSSNSNSPMASGGSAGGYLGKGANGTAATTSGTVVSYVTGSAGQNGAGGSGSIETSAGGTGSQGYVGGSGGTGPWGMGTNGAAGISSWAGLNGKGGSDGGDGVWTAGTQGYSPHAGLPGLYGAGASCSADAATFALGADGCARLLWGMGRYFPSTDVGQGS